MEKCYRFVLYNKTEKVLAELDTTARRIAVLHLKPTNVWQISSQTLQLIYHNSPGFCFWTSRDNLSSFLKCVLRCVEGYVIFMVYTIIDLNSRPMSERILSVIVKKK